MITNNKSMGQQTMEHMFRGSTGIIVVGFRVQVGPDQPKTSWRSLISNKSSAKMTHLRNTREKCCNLAQCIHSMRVKSPLELQFTQ